MSKHFINCKLTPCYECDEYVITSGLWQLALPHPDTVIHPHLRFIIEGPHPDHILRAHQHSITCLLADCQQCQTLYDYIHGDDDLGLVWLFA